MGVDKKGSANQRKVEGRDKYEISCGDNEWREPEGLLTGGQFHDEKVAGELVEAVMGCAVIADRGYAGDGFCRELEGNNNEVVIPGGKSRKEAIVYNQEKYKKCGLIERLFGKIKENCRLTVRYEKSDITFLGFILIAFLKILLC